MAIFQTTQRKRKLSGNHILPTTSCPFCHYRNDPINKGFHSCCGIDLQGSELAHLQQHGIEIAYDGSKYHEDSVLFQKTFWKIVPSEVIVHLPFVVLQPMWNAIVCACSQACF